MSGPKGDRDPFDFERRGRVVGEEQHRRAVAERTRQVLRAVSPSHRPSSQPGRASALSPGGDSGGQASRETVLKVIGWAKRPQSAFRQADYISRNREVDRDADAVPLENQDGRQFSDRRAIKDELRDWQLTPMNENRSKTWREASADDRAQMPESEAFYRKQSGHLVFSLPKTAQADPAQLRQAVREGLDETLGRQGFRYLWGVHTDHSHRPHVHVIVKARSEGISGYEGRQIRLGPKELHTMRQVLTDQVRGLGLDVSCTRRTDRPELREQIAQGKAPLRANEDRQGRPQTHQGSVFERKAPAWYEAHGPAYERRRMNAFDGSRAVDPQRQDPQGASGEIRKGVFGRLRAAVGGRQAEPASVTPAGPQRPHSPALSRVDGHFKVTHQNPTDARESFLQMYAEAPKLAVWAANNHPQAFGETTGEKAPRFTGRGIRAALQPEPAKRSTDPTERRSMRQEAHELRQGGDQAKAKSAAERNQLSIGRSLDRLAQQVRQHQAGLDPSAAADKLKALSSETTRNQVQSNAERLADMREKTMKRVQARERAQAQSRGRGISH